jgi:hypothetical protein
MMRRIPCLDRIKEQIGYHPTTGLEQILKLVIAEKRESAGQPRD